MTTSSTFTAEIREVPPQPYLGRRLRAPLDGVGPLVQQAFEALYKEIAELRMAPSGPPFLIAEQPQGGHLDMEVGAPCASAPAAKEGFEAGTLPGGKVAVTVHRGPYEQVGTLYPLLATWIRDHGWTIAGPPREVYLTPPGEEPVTEIAWPVGGAGR